MARKLPAPPSSITGVLGIWLQKLHLHIEAQPNHSLASFGAAETPNSRVTGRPGDFCTNIGSASTSSRFWILGGGTQSALTNQGWMLVRIVTP